MGHDHRAHDGFAADGAQVARQFGKGFCLCRGKGCTLLAIGFFPFHEFADLAAQLAE